MKQIVVHAEDFHNRVISFKTLTGFAVVVVGEAVVVVVEVVVSVPLPVPESPVPAPVSVLLDPVSVVSSAVELVVSRFFLRSGGPSSVSAGGWMALASTSFIEMTVEPT